MDGTLIEWYSSCMSQPAHIPNFNLFGETTAFPDVVHCEAVLDRAGQHGWRISPHRHTQMAQVFQISSGAAQVTLDGLERRLEPGQYLYIPPQVVHGFDEGRCLIGRERHWRGVKRLGIAVKQRTFS